MNARLLLLSAALAAAIAAGGYHWKTRLARSRLETDRAQVARDAAEQRRLAAEISAQVATAQGEVQVLLASRMNRPGAAASPGVHAGPAGVTPTSSAKPAVPLNAELRGWKVQAFASEQRLRYTALFDRLGFTAEKRQAFDRIQTSCQEVMLDDSQPESARRQARDTRDAGLKELFGSHFDEWVDANRHEPARAVVTEIVQKTFQSSGALTTAQAEELTRIVARHRLPPAPGSARHDWESIISEAQALLADRQKEDFIAAVKYREASERMSAIAAKKKAKG